jgi:DNA-binding transcriptional ArsR family regulator
MSKTEPAVLFAALGDPTRLSVIARLGDGTAHSIGQIGDGLPMSRQAITKHLAVLQQAGLVQRTKSGREVHFLLRRQAIEEARTWLDTVGAHWDDVLVRFKTFVEET